MKKIAGILAINLAAVPGALHAAASHCAAQEKTVFSCSVGAKTVSVCASKEVSPTAGSIQYRFGPEGHPEISLPDPAAPPASAAKGGTLMYSGGGGAFLRFSKGEYNYVVYTGSGKGWKKDGVAVDKVGKLVANFRCKGAPVSELGQDFFQGAGIPQDERDFDIP